ncbi:MAG TPA: hypothetical protein DDX39_09560 [Bacteroidales bacterium]|nr:MAG: hypothetical protein A2W98_15465 [Bacteroidetes bacterium GWF2_33_38]OFY73566.1 MAG: hypothetical protein A2265_09365 [Bacteroidetes bacterium RIFOXYA12_FULL_33_9]OFY91466.1 MAG: hypothetical protein A2236_03335 [Bacteroidetes bacterium RIFOXYA2_FULL_33_7]HBF88875.1 hypothetical protein [Bacteroidales bacterium]
MKTLDNRIVKFIKLHHVLTLATSVENKAYCANCFYAYMEDENMLVFTSDKNTKHIKDVEKNSFVAGSIVLETRIVGKIQGIQLNGILSEPRGDMIKKANKTYLKRFPFALLMNTTLWTLDLTFLKFTDNTLGFGKKLIWEKENQ